MISHRPITAREQNAGYSLSDVARACDCNSAFLEGSVRIGYASCSSKKDVKQMDSILSPQLIGMLIALAGNIHSVLHAQHAATSRPRLYAYGRL
jgi:hypothetical protein